MTELQWHDQGRNNFSATGADNQRGYKIFSWPGVDLPWKAVRVQGTPRLGEAATLPEAQQLCQTWENAEPESVADVEILAAMEDA